MPTKVLVFDKNPQRKNVIEAALDSDTYLLAFARDGREGVAKFEAFKPDFLIANETLDDISGLKVFRDLKKTGKITDSQFILMTREGEEEDLVPEKVFFLKKPFKTADIINLLEEVKMVKDNQSDFDLVEAEMDKVVQNLRKDSDEIMDDISSNPPAAKLSSDELLDDAFETSEELEIIDDLLEANDEELENLIDENENYSSEKLGVEPEKEKSREDELNDLEKELYGEDEGELNSLAETEEAGSESIVEEEIPDDMLMDLDDVVEDETPDERVVEEDALNVPELDTEPLDSPTIDETEAREAFDDLLAPEEISEEMLMESLNEEEPVAGDTEEESELTEISDMLNEEKVTEEDLINDYIYSEDDNEENVEASASEEPSEEEEEVVDILDEISDEEFQSAAEMQGEKVEERTMDLDLDLDLDDEDFQAPEETSPKETTHHGIDESLTFGEDLTEEDLAQSDAPDHDIDESVIESNAEEIKAEAAKGNLDSVMHGMVEEIVRSEVKKALEKALPELTASIEEHVKDIAPAIIKQVVTEEIEKLKEG